MKKKIVIISGVSKGLGLAISKMLLKKNWIIAGFSRSKSPEVKILLNKYKKIFILKHLM